MTAKADPGEIGLGVGANLSGMPLNGELTSRNASFLRTGPTASLQKARNVIDQP